MTAAKKDAVRLRMEISFIGPESALSDPSKPVNFLFVLGHDTNGRSSKAVFYGPHAQRLRASLLQAIEGSDLKTRRPAIEAVGEWGFAKEPRKKNGEIVKDASGKPVHDRQFEAKAPATMLAGPPLELFRTQRAAMRALKAAGALGSEADTAEKAGNLATALAKAKEANAGLISFLSTLAKRGVTTAAPTDEYQAVVAAATEGTTNESLSEAAPASEPDAARPIPGAEEVAPAVSSPAKPSAGTAMARPRLGSLARVRPTTQVAAAETVSDDQAKQSVSEQPPVVDTAQAPVQPTVDPEAEAQARFAKAGKDFVDAEAGAPALVAEASGNPPPPPTERPVPQPPSEAPPPPPPSERPAPQPPSEAPRPAPPRRMGFPSMRPR